MKQFMLVYSGPTPRLGKETAEQLQAEWQQITQSLGPALVDPGKVFVNGVELIDMGMIDDFVAMNGYSIVQGQDLNSVLTLLRAHPYLSRKEGRYSVMVFELMTEPATSYTADQATPNLPPETTEAYPGDEDEAEETEQPIGQTQAAPQTVITPQPTPVQNPGELTIPHEQPTDEQQPPTLPNPQ